MNTLQIALTAVMTVATVAYAILTLVLVKETIRLREVETEPEIVVYLQPQEFSPSLIDIVVKNIGAGTAYNIRWSFDHNAPLITERKVGLNKMKFFDGVPYFAPGQTFVSFFATGVDLLREPVPPALEVQVEFQNRKGKTYTRQFILDPMQFYGRTWVDNQPLREIAKGIKNIESRFTRVLSGFQRIKVDIYNQEDRKQERIEREKRFARMSDKESEDLNAG